MVVLPPNESEVMEQVAAIIGAMGEDDPSTPVPAVGGTTAKDVQTRVLAARRLLEDGKSESLIARAMARSYSLSMKQVRSYIRAARQTIRDDLTAETKDDVRAFCRNTLASIAADTQVKPSSRISAVNSMMRLYDLAPEESPPEDSRVLARRAAAMMTEAELMVLAAAHYRSLGMELTIPGMVIESNAVEVSREDV